MRKAATLALGLSLASLLTIPAFADHLNGRLKSVDADANTITVVQAHKDYTFSVPTDAHILDIKGEALTDGLKSTELSPGTRLSIEYKKDTTTSVASEIKLRPAAKHTAKTKTEKKTETTTTTTPATPAEQ